ncbi:MAG: type II toxin-antitoxin system RelE/ParE family toxin [Nostoc sp.]|uniref:type II toxin-antitoxin system RelE/ParE family toxin n=1 Tax=Nostoc sp. TaxID=1180 RepID=UPI002FEF83F7
MSFYFLSLQAAQDLQEINDYLFAGNPDVADRLLTLITQKLDILARFPSMRRRRMNFYLHCVAFQLMII